MSDAVALDWLDRLLNEDELRRAALLGELAVTNPDLHSRLQRLLAAALAPEQSRVLARPVVEGIASLDAMATPSLSAGTVLAGYRLIRELGRGGMSVVWLAERADGVVKREVALKMPMFMLRDDVDVARFARERDALAALSHPHVARLYDAGVLPSGQPFIVLERIDGQPLTTHCESKQLTVEARLRLFLQVLAAVDHAHKHLVVHRDLKPSNILVDAEGQVKLLDFGIAKLLDDEAARAELTAAAGGAMTPIYAAPEQLRSQAISTLTDVFSLGVVLHELLTGKLPYRRADGARPTLVEVLETQARGELVRDTPHGDLDTVVGKALRLKPEERYGSAAHFAEDLKRFLDRRPIAARPPSLWYRTRLALARHRLAASVAGVGVALVGGASVVAWQQHRESLAHAERTAAVRDFMFDLVNDAEASEGQQGEVTGKQMVDGAVKRARRDFGSQPQLQGELLGELGRMYIRLGSVDAALPVLEESVTVLEKVAPADDAALNKARAFLASALLETGGDEVRVGSLAFTARKACANDSVDCAKARAYASNILSQLAALHGDDEVALAEMRQSAADIEKAFGASHEDTVMALLNVAVIARNAGHLIEAGEAVQRAAGIARHLQLRASDRRQLDRAMAMIDLDLGRYAAARERLQALVTQPADEVERVLQLRLLATVLVELGEGAEAFRQSRAALALIPADDVGTRRAYAEQAMARSMSLLGRHEEAIAAINAVIHRLTQAGSAGDSFEVLRARRYRAGFLQLAGRNAAALNELREVKNLLTADGASPVERGLVLDALGEAERRAGNGKASQLAHEAAGVELAKQLPREHPYVIRNTALRKGA